MATDEAQQIEAVARRLAQRYPGIPVGEVTDSVYLAYGEFADARVRDFIPLLVERRATRALTAALIGTTEHRTVPSLT